MDAIEQVDHTMYVLQPVRGFYTSFRRDLLLSLFINSYDRHTDTKSSSQNGEQWLRG